MLKAYAQYNPDVGYCQGMGLLVGMMLMIMPAEDAFWLLVSTVDKYLQGIYSSNLDRIRMHASVFEYLLSRHLPRLYKHLKKHDIAPIVYITPWFMTLYTMSLPWPTVLRIWDMFYFDGVKSLFRVGLAILYINQPQILKMPSSTDIIPHLLHLPPERFPPESIIKNALKFSIGKMTIAELEIKAQEAWDKNGRPDRGTVSIMKKP